MMPALKHMDMMTGFDTHIVLIPSPAGPIPTPLPHPYVGMLFDPLDYAPIVGATVYINGMPRATAGTSGMAIVPHIPMGGPFAKPPSNESEMFMGSSTVLVEGEPQSFATCPALSCQDVGIPAPLRAKKKSSAKSLMLPVTMVMPIPAGAPVLIGGAPTIMMPGAEVLIGPLAKGLSKAAKAVAKKSKRLRRGMKVLSKRLHGMADAVLDKLKIGKQSALRNKVHRGICAVTGHPVDIATGKMFTEFVDLTLPGPLPFALERVWYSTSTYPGPFGHGWHASFDMGLVTSKRWVGVRLADGRVSVFPRLEIGASCYDAEDKATLARDHHGYAFTDAQGLTHRFVSVGGREEQVLASIQDRNGFAIQFEYAAGRLSKITDSSGRPWDIECDHKGRITRVVGVHPEDPNQRAVSMTYTYDSWGNLYEARDALGGCERFRYERHLLVQETKKSGLSFYFQYDARDERARCIRTWGDGGIYDHKLTYAPARTVVENSLGHKTTYVHDGAMVTETLDALGNTTETHYDNAYRVTMSLDELGNPSLFKYDARGNLAESMTPDGAIVKLEYGPHDLPLRALDPLGGEWTWVRDERGRVVERKDPLGRVTRYYYQGPWLVGITDAAGGYTGIGYDPMGNVDAIGAPDQRTTHYRHDLLGRLIAVQDPKGNVQRRTLDGLGRAVRVDEPDGNVRTFEYDAEGNVVHAKDQHHDVRFVYQGVNRLASRSEAGTTVRFEYNTEEQLTAIFNEHGRVYRFVLGPTGEVDEEHGFDGLMRKYTRDEAGRVTRVDRPGERFSEYDHDPLGRVIKIEHSDESTERYSYRRDGSLASASNKHASVVFERDVLGRILKETCGREWVESAYGLDDLRVHVRSSKGLDQAIDRNLMGDVTRVATDAFEARFTRDELGLELERSLPGGLRSTWQRDHVGRPTQHSVSNETGLLRAVGYKWEPNDRLRMLIDGMHGPTEFYHDALGNLAAARHPSGELELRMPDAVGNLFKREDRGDRQYGPAGQLLAQGTPRGPIHYVYDPEGNLIEKREPNGAVWRYAWNVAGMLAKVIRPDGSEVTFAYDALGRRIKKTYRGQTTHFMWDGNTPLHEWVEGKLKVRDEDEPPFIWRADPIIKKREAELEALLAQGPPQRGTKDAPITWLFEPESFAPMAKLVGGEQFSVVTDHLGTPVLMADAHGKRVWSAAISVYGELRELEGERHACPFRWPGQYEDAETGLYYNRFRYYDPEAGQYTSQDPLGIEPALNSHGYISDPLTEDDPLGLWRRRRNNGQFASKPGPKPRNSGHGNSRASDKPAVLYALHDDQGDFQKWGITQETSDPKKRYGKTIPDEWTPVPVDRGKRSAMLDLERELVEKDPGPKNREKFRGKRVGQPMSKRAARACGKVGR